MTLTINEFARMGGVARWKGKTKKERKEAMSKLADISKKRRAEAKELGSKP